MVEQAEPVEVLGHPPDRRARRHRHAEARLGGRAHESLDTRHRGLGPHLFVMRETTTLDDSFPVGERADRGLEIRVPRFVRASRSGPATARP